MANVILVTGGTGLVGKAIQHIIETEAENSRFGRKPGETWIFASSAEADLRLDGASMNKRHRSHSFYLGIQNKRVNCTKSTSQHMSYISLHLVRYSLVGKVSVVIQIGSVGGLFRNMKYKACLHPRAITNRQLWLDS